MKKLERLTQDESGCGYQIKDNQYRFQLIPLEKLITFVVQNPSDSIELDKKVHEIAEGIRFISQTANAYAVSEFNPDTQHIRKVGGVDKIFSVYAVQFYSALKR